MLLPVRRTRAAVARILMLPPLFVLRRPPAKTVAATDAFAFPTRARFAKTKVPYAAEGVAQSGETKRETESKVTTKARVVEKLSSTHERAINASKRDRESILSGRGKVNQKPK